ncbi:MAG: hypothetical protein ACREN2_02555 [Candidatus Dormibacteria bacterium]
MASHYLRYALYRFYRLQIRLTLAVFAAAAVFVVLAAVIGIGSSGSPPPPLTFAMFFTACVLWLEYWFGFRIAYWMEARDGWLTWRTPLRSGSVPISEVRSIYSSALLQGMGVVRTTRGRILIFPTQYFPQFADRMAALYPSVVARVGRFSRFSARLSGRFAPRGGTLSMTLEEGDD